VVGVLLGNGDGTFQKAVTYDSGGPVLYSFESLVAVADVNGDGKPDLVVAECSDDRCSDGVVGVLLGNGDGTFQTAVNYGSGGYLATSVAVADGLDQQCCQAAVIDAWASLPFFSQVTTSGTTAPTSSAITPSSCLLLAFQVVGDSAEMLDLLQSAMQGVDVGFPTAGTIGVPAVGDGLTAVLNDGKDGHGDTADAEGVINLCTAVNLQLLGWFRGADADVAAATLDEQRIGLLKRADRRGGDASGRSPHV
jgi:hypothetical protein